MSANDVPPPYTMVARHGMFPETTHDETARYNFLANLNRYLSGDLGAGNRLTYEHRVLPDFKAEHGREPADRHEIRTAMNRDSWHRFWSAMKRNSMEMRQQNGRATVLRQLDDLDARANALNEGRNTLQLDPAVAIPHYQRAVDIHCMPGSYFGEEREGDVSAGANYDSGMFATTGGALGAHTDGGGQALVAWARQNRPEWKPQRILDIGCTIGHNAVPLAQAYPDAEVIAIDVAAPALRYGHARAQSMGVKNIIFRQIDAEDLSEFSDGSFDWVQTTMFLHELSGSSLPKIVGEAARVLRPGGLMLHIEQPEYTDAMPLFEQFMRDWDAYNNNEPFWGAMHELDMGEVMEDAGLPKAAQFTIGVKAVVDETVFPPAPSGKEEDYGRAAIWNAYGAWKPES